MERGSVVGVGDGDAENIKVKSQSLANNATRVSYRTSKQAKKIRGMQRSNASFHSDPIDPFIQLCNHAPLRHLRRG